MHTPSKEHRSLSYRKNTHFGYKIVSYLHKFHSRILSDCKKFTFFLLISKKSSIFAVAKSVKPQDQLLAAPHRFARIKNCVMKKGLVIGMLGALFAMRRYLKV